MASHQANNCYWEFNPAFFKTAHAAIFSPSYWEKLGQISGQEKGRGTTWFFEHEGASLVLRHYLRGGLVGKLIKDHYLYTSLASCRSIHEYRILSELHQKQLPVPRPAAAQVRKKGFVYQADLIIERIPGAQDLVALLQGPQPDSLYKRIGVMIAGFHKLGVYHADLNIKNILVDTASKLWLIDFDRAELGVSLGVRQHKSIERLKRSFQKEVVRHGIQFGNEQWDLLYSAYKEALKQ